MMSGGRYWPDDLRELGAELCCVACHATADEHGTVMDREPGRYGVYLPCPGAVRYANGKFSSELKLVESR